MAKPTGFRGAFRDDEVACAVYSEGAGIARAIPDAVAVPADADDVSAIVAWAWETGTAIIPRGSGSGMAGGATGSGVVVDLSRLDDIADVPGDPSRMWVGPGALRGAVNRRAEVRGLRFPIDPSSGGFCTLGGMVATNAAGAHSLQFGSVRRWITALDCVFADGSRATVRRGEPEPTGVPAIRRFSEHAEELRGSANRGELGHSQVRKQSSGYALAEYADTGELVDLLVGSEGSLVLFVGIELALTPLPAATSSLLAAFPALGAAAEGAACASARGATACELLDRTFLDVARAGETLVPAPEGTEAVLLIEFEADTASRANDKARLMKRALVDAGASEVVVALHPMMERMLWSLRHAASPVLMTLDPRLRSMQFIEDGAVPPSHLAEYIHGIRASLASRGIRGVIFGHAGDAHLHVNPLIDVHQSDWRAGVLDLLDEVTRLTADLYGTLSGEHGDGRLRTPLLDRVWNPAATAAFRRVKKAFDPDGTLNPGVKVPLDGQRSIDQVKYDPQLAPLPPRARAALDLVARESAYGHFRLALLGDPD
ncbi:MAG: FAD-binding oxidoreductase [Gemmatimonadaceae bacterium]